MSVVRVNPVGAVAIAVALAVTGCGRRNFNVDGDLDARLDAGAGSCSDLNCAFVTTAPYRGDLGGLVGADQKCQDEATDAGRPGTYRAWLSTSQIDAPARFATARGWILVDGRPVVRDRIAELLVVGPLSMISLTANSQDLRQPGVPILIWTGTSATGSLAASCMDWTSEATTNAGMVGEADEGGQRFTGESTPMCQTANRLLCLGTDHATPIAIPAPTGRIAFVSSAQFSPPTGIGAADAICASEGAVLGARTFRAALAPVGTSIASRFSSSMHDYSRVDGVHVGRLLNSTLNDSFVNLTAARSLVIDLVWTGGRPSDVAILSEACGDWSATGSGGIAGESNESSIDMWDRVGGELCSNGHPIYCLED